LINAAVPSGFDGAISVLGTALITTKKYSFLRVSRAGQLLCMALMLTAASGFAATDREGAAALREKYAALEPQMRQTVFLRPLTLESSEESDRVKGEVYGVLDYSFDAVRESLAGAREWCDVLILHVNTKYCNARRSGGEVSLTMYIGGKTYEGLGSANLAVFKYRPAFSTRDYYEIGMTAASGPMSTTDYRILVRAIPLSGKRTFLHLSYSYAYGFAGKIAMRVYLSTVGSGKVGFTRVGNDYIGGMRGLVERNVMRYFLGIDALLGAADLPPEEQSELRIQNWYALAELYPRQLHDLDRAAYSDLKRREIGRQNMPE
jgi:hypothetical protein